ncbi:hypothetical protein ACH4PU_15165 [Streptomyces sp. NPDC021100]|uniref:hypothetical protein n=1 Tax=Streptomyces sp. NPDC021100 TaxID=3365114 RepID=UPI0037A73665
MAMRDGDSAVRHARFGALPERIAYEDMVEEKAASRAAPPEYGGEPGVRTHLGCLAWDLGL